MKTIKHYPMIERVRVSYHCQLQRRKTTTTTTTVGHLTFLNQGQQLYFISLYDKLEMIV